MHRNEKVLRAALAALASGDQDAYAAVVADDLIVHVPGRSLLAGDLRGRGVFGRKIRELTGGTFRVEVHDVLASDDHAVGVYTNHVEGADGRFQWRQVNVYHVRHGKIVEAWQNPFEQDAFDEFFGRSRSSGRMERAG